MQTPDQSEKIFPEYRFPWTGKLSTDQLRQEIERGARFTRYDCVVSLLFVTFRFQSRIHLIRNDWSMFIRGYLYTLITLVAGWWSFPWGPIDTVLSIWANLNGGWDSTSEIEAMLPVLPEIEIE